MYFKIILEFVLLCLCYGDCTKQAVSSISYHDEKTKNGNNFNVNYLQNAPVVYKSIQYAPLPIYYKEKDTLFMNSIISNKTNDYSITTKENRKDHLEPRDHHCNNNYYNTKATPRFIIGHNIETPGNIKLRKENFNTRYQNYEHLTTTTTTEYLKEKKENITNITNLDHIESGKFLKSNIFRTFNINHQKKPVRTFEVLYAMENSKIQPALNSFYNIRVPQLNINVARSYNIARSPYKALTYRYKNLQHKAFNIYE